VPLVATGIYLIWRAMKKSKSQSQTTV